VNSALYRPVSVRGAALAQVDMSLFVWMSNDEVTVCRLCWRVGVC